MKQFLTLHKYAPQFSSIIGRQHWLGSFRKYGTDVDQLKKCSDLSHIRNVGIIAHIDAGKTTVTERMLYLAGAIRTVGDVDSGTTVTDYLELERERGITIQSAAIFFKWMNCKVNLIDTPGHVDFSLEVERCARVLDGAVTVLDASAGVQAQTINVWQQAKKYCLSGTLFVNKMDKPTANFKKALESIESRLSLKNAVPIVIPVYSSDGDFCGICDLIERKYLDCTVGDKAGWTGVCKRNKITVVQFNNFLYMYDTMMLGREEMLSKLADADDEFGRWLLRQPKTDSESFDTRIDQCLRTNTVSRNVVTIACGTALRCAESVRPVMNTVAKYFPLPNEKNDLATKLYGSSLSALVFKINHDKRLGQLNYIRVYTGQLRNGSSVYNANQYKTENHVSTFLPYSDVLKPVGRVEAGDIAVVTGLESTVTGDTLVQSEKFFKDIAKEKTVSTANCTVKEDEDDGTTKLRKSLLLAGIDAPDPVFFCSIEPPDIGSQRLFDKALHELTVEDPSLRIRTDGDGGQTIIETMGELHLEIVKDKLLRDYGLKVFFGPVQVAYREIPDGSIVHSTTVCNVVGEKKVKHECSVSFEVSSKPKIGLFKKVKVSLIEQDEYVIRPEWLKAINEGCKVALLSGPVLGCPVLDVEIVLVSFKVSGGKILPSIISAAACKCVREAIASIPVHVIEPVVDVEVEFHGTNSGGTAANRVLQEISIRRGNVIGTDGDAGCNAAEGDDNGSSSFRISARIPVGETMGLSTAVRTLTSGLGNLHMRLAGYVAVPEEVKSLLTEKIKGIN